MGTDFLSGGEETGHEVTSSLHSSTEGRNEWGSTFVSPIHLHGIDAQNSTFYLLAHLVCGVCLIVYAKGKEDIFPQLWQKGNQILSKMYGLRSR
jgi:hypothetical protein